MKIFAFCNRRVIALFRMAHVSRFVTQTWMVMRLTFMLLTAFCMQVSAKSWSQSITLKGNEVTLEHVFYEVQKQTGYFVIYDAEILKISKPVTVHCVAVPVGKFMEDILKDQPLTFFLRKTTIVIERTKEAPLLKSDVTDMDPERIVTRGRIVDESGEPVSGATVKIKGRDTGTSTDANGEFTLSGLEENAILEISGINIRTFEIKLAGRTDLGNIAAKKRVTEAETVVVVGYGTQKRSDLTGTVASVPKERLDMVPNTNIAQAIQGAIPGVIVQTTTAGAEPAQSFMIRGRKSIRASNSPLLVVDGIPYSGSISDLNPNDVKSIEVLKDASSAAIYGSRGANGVILVTTKQGKKGKMQVSYNLKHAIQNFANVPDVMTGDEFYEYKMLRSPIGMTAFEQGIYDEKKWVNWYDLATRTGRSQDHELSVSGGAEHVTYYVSGGLLDVKGVTINDNFKRATGRVNLEINMTPWLTLGTRTQMSYTNRNGAPPDFNWVYYSNPLTQPFDDNGNLTLFPYAGNEDIGNPLEGTLWTNKNESQQIITNNYLRVDVPFVKGLSYLLNTGYRSTKASGYNYAARNSTTGLKNAGSASSFNNDHRNAVLENILSYSRSFGNHNLAATAVYSFEETENATTNITARGFPHDFLTIYSISQAVFSQPSYGYDKSNLISQMFRLNYGYDNRYLVTLTGRRDGYSGFGDRTKWGVFPSVAVGWNLANEAFFPWKDQFSELKLRASWGENGNQALESYTTISQLSGYNIIDGGITQSGYIPSVLGQDNLGWETSRTFNLGLDLGLFSGRLTAGLNIFKTSTFDLLLNRSISPVHGLSSITQNIGKTENKGLEMSLQFRTIKRNSFGWSTQGNFSFLKNKIIDLYGNGLNDMGNLWFIGSPIAVNFDYLVEGVWQENEAGEAAKWNSRPGFVKIRDLNKDGKLTSDDRQIIGQRDPKFIWGLGNTFTYKNFNLIVFIHGVHGSTRTSGLMTDRETWGVDLRRNTINKNWWTPQNPTNEYVMNHLDAELMSGIRGVWYESADFVRLKDVTLSYNLSDQLLQKLRLDRLRFFVTGRNLYTVTNWTGLDPEVASQLAMPLQKEYVFGINVGL